MRRNAKKSIRPAPALGTGFSLVETMVMLSIVGMMAVLGMLSIRAASAQFFFRDTTQQTIGAFERARNRAMTGLGGTDQGVHIESNRIILFEGSTYPGTGTVYPFASAINASGATDIVFKRLSGASNGGTVTISDASRSQQITVDVQGSIRTQ